MKNILKSTVLAAGMLLAAGTASADMHNRDVVKNSFGHVVRNSFQNCVETKWDGAGECGGLIASEMRTIYFDFDSAALTPAGRAKLDTLAGLIGNDGSIRHVRIIGFADVIGSNSYNQSLSQRRADVVRAYLQAKGVNVNGGSEVRGLGESSSQSQCAGQKGNALKACLWRDRRVEVEIVK
jgi:outer membrane protein OmpA-like peptidoglycan-associated protein